MPLFVCTVCVRRSVCVRVRLCGCWHKPNFKQKKAESIRRCSYETSQLRLLANGNRTHTHAPQTYTYTHIYVHIYPSSAKWLLGFVGPLKRQQLRTALKYIVNRIYNTQNKVFSQSYTKVFYKSCRPPSFLSFPSPKSRFRSCPGPWGWKRASPFSRFVCLIFGIVLHLLILRPCPQKSKVELDQIKKGLASTFGEFPNGSYRLICILSLKF